MVSVDCSACWDPTNYGGWEHLIISPYQPYYLNLPSELEIPESSPKGSKLNESKQLLPSFREDALSFLAFLQALKICYLDKNLGF